MMIELLDPVGEVETVHPQQERTPENLKGKRVGYIFNQHRSALAFWKALERGIDETLNPMAAYRVYKENTWAPAPKAELECLIREADYALVGVGA